MSKQAAEDHRKAAEHHEYTARHHKEAAKHHEAGKHETAAHHAHLARGHHEHATHHAAEAAKAHIEDHGKAKTEQRIERTVDQSEQQLPEQRLGWNTEDLEHQTLSPKKSIPAYAGIDRWISW